MFDLFLIKKIIGLLAMPLTIIILLLLISLVFFHLKPKLARRCLFFSCLLLVLSTQKQVADFAMTPLENSFPTFQKSKQTIDYIVVLGCYHQSDETIPATSQLYPCSLQRLTEALRVYQLHPEATIITSGYKFSDPASNAEVMKNAAISLGVEANKILTEPFPKDTEEEAQLIAPRILNSSVVLVTNAYHMPRAMNYFRQYGVNAIPAPAGHWVKNNNVPSGWGLYVPRAQNLKQISLAWYETLGRGWQWLKKKF